MFQTRVLSFEESQVSRDAGSSTWREVVAPPAARGLEAISFIYTVEQLALFLKL